MNRIRISDELARLVPGIALSCIESTVKYEDINSELWDEIQSKTNEISSSVQIDDIRWIPAIDSSRKAYKACGIDPARYRLSAEALLRRVVNRNGIYQVNNLVDLLNLVSVSTGYSIGGYDASRISGEIIFGIGIKDELYEGIGRGRFNIEAMPVFRDSMGAFGTSTSDSVRTSVTASTVRFLMVIVDYNESVMLKTATEMAIQLLEKYAFASDIQVNKINYVATNL